MRRLLILTSLFASLLVASTAQAQITKMVFDSPPGDYIGQAQSYTLTPADGLTFDGTTNYYGGVEINIHNANYSQWWQIDMSDSAKTALTVRKYENCVRFPSGRDTLHNEVQISVPGRTCNSLSGKFEIKYLTWDTPIKIHSLWVTIEQSCEGFMPPLKVEVMLNMDAQVPTRTRTWGSLKSIYR